jgi:predicted ATPase/class 3 adenylate cyclase
MSQTEPIERHSEIGGEVRTFLIADVRGYTLFTQEHGDEAAARLAAAFAAIAREAVAARHGEVIELRGDEALAVFLSPRQAIRSAVDLQRRFAAEASADPDLPLNVGIGIEAGEAMPVQGGYRGGALNLAARLCSLAGPGEVFTTETVIGLARKTEGISFLDRGEVQLKGLSKPVRVIQVAAEGALPNDAAALQPILVTHTTNLPDEPTPFIGRGQHVEAIAQLLGEPQVRMVTLTGPGGTGKTRLALQVGGRLLDRFRDGIFFVSLASLSDPGLVLPTVAETLGVREEAGRPLLRTLNDSLGDKQTLLVLDNFEHLLDASTVVASLLDACRHLHVLVTSRIPLHLAREHEYAVPPLSMPDPQNLPEIEALRQYEAVALFIDRARAVKTGFTVTNENAPAVAEICARLDGLPLAIELAAARIKVFPPQALLARLSSRLKMLTTSAGDRPGRQQTLRGAIEWSYLLLGPEEQRVFARLSVFTGGCTLEALEAICGDDVGLDVIDGMGSLVEKSLLQQAEQPDGEPRFTMLETIREYAEERLEEAGESGALREVHARYFAALCRETRPQLNTPAETDWNRRMTWDIANLRAAGEWLREYDPAAGLLVGVDLYSFWAMRGFFSDIRQWLDDVERQRQFVAPEERVSVIDTAAKLVIEAYGDRARSERLRAEALELRRDLGDTTAVADEITLAGERALTEGDAVRAETLYIESLALQRQVGNSKGIFAALNGLVMAANHRGDWAAAQVRAEEAVALARTQDDNHELAAWLNVLGQSLVWQGLPGAEIVLQESLRLRRDLEDLNCIPRSLTTLAELALEEGDPARAAVLQEESLRIVRDLGHKERVAWSLFLLGRAAGMSGDGRRADDRYRESLLIGQEAGNRRAVAASLAGLAERAAAEGTAGYAARLMGAAGAILASLPEQVPPPELTWQGRCRDTIRERLSDHEWEIGWNEGRSLAEDGISALALTPPA